MFERFSQVAVQAVALAQEEARLFGHNYVGTEHLLLGLLRQDGGNAAQVLSSLGLTVDGARREVAEVVGPGDDAGIWQLRFTRRGKNALELSVAEASALGHATIGTEHVLLGLAGQSDGIAARVMLGAGLDAKRVRAEVRRHIGGRARVDEAALGDGVSPPTPSRWVDLDDDVR